MLTTSSKKKDLDKPSVIPWDKYLLSPRDILLSMLFGAILGLAAPGINLWFIAWIGLTPLILFTARSQSFVQAFWHGLLFGTCYNLVYLNWYLGLTPLDWLGFNWWQGWLLAIAALSIVSFHQGLIIGLSTLIISIIPMSANFIPVKKSGKWYLPVYLAFPTLWVVLVSKVFNAADALGVPWTNIEYTQYQQTQLIQSASLIGGIGIGALILMSNTALACLFATYKKKSKYKSLAVKTKGLAVKNLVIVFTAIITIISLGLYDSSKANVKTTDDLYMLQGNINIEMQKSEKQMDIYDLLDSYKAVLEDTSSGIMVWTESAVPIYLAKSPSVLALLSLEAAKKNQDMVVGAIHKDREGNPYNSAYGITSKGKLLDNVYHKRYLVPFGEYAPALINLFPKEVRRLTNTPAGSGFSAGKAPEVLELDRGKIAPLICFECISPEVVASSTNAGGELLVNVSDLAWFHESIIGEQMIAFSVFRAIENRRFLAFAANTGPSVIINPRGKITARSKLSKQCIVKGRVNFSKQKTFFSKWFN